MPSTVYIAYTPVDIGGAIYVGMLFRGKTDQKEQKTMSTPSPSHATKAAETEDFDKAIESVARILRSLGRHAFDLEELSEKDIEKEFER